MEIGSRPASIQVDLAPMEAISYLHVLPSTSLEVGSIFHVGSSSVGLVLGLVLWKQLEVCDTRGSRWKYARVCGSSGKLPRNIFVEAVTDRRSGSCRDRSKLTSMDVSMEVGGNFHGSRWNGGR